MKIALIADELTSTALKYEAEIYHITPLNYKVILHFVRPDILFVESAWNGYKNSWKYKIASYPDIPKRNNQKLKKVVDYAKRLGIPTLFWNKEDGVHFERFIESARLFDHIFTVDKSCIPRYREVVDTKVTVNTLMFAVQPRIHYFKGFDFKYHRACFVGSYSKHIHTRRRQWQEVLFKSAVKCGLGLTVFDRNSTRASVNYRYPAYASVDIKDSVPYVQTAQIYRDYLVSLNVNTIEDSETMFSRRLIEILACGGIAVTTPSKAVSKYFAPYCHVVHNEEEMEVLCERLKEGPSPEDLSMAESGAAYVCAEHTWAHRLKEIEQVIKDSCA
jgi:spore maturation protein CgeB